MSARPATVRRRWASSTRTSRRCGPPPTSSPSSPSTPQLRRSASAGWACARSTREKSPSFCVNQELGLYHCFGCGAKGDVITFVREMEHLDFVGAVELLAGWAGHHAALHGQGRAARAASAGPGSWRAVEQAVDWYHERLLSAPGRRGGPQVPARAGASSATRCGPSGSAGRPRAGTSWCGAHGCPTTSWRTPGLGFLNSATAARPTSSGAASCSRSSTSTATPSASVGGSCPAPRARSTRTRRRPRSTRSPSCSTASNWSKAAHRRPTTAPSCARATPTSSASPGPGVPPAVATCGTALTEEHVKLLRRFARRLVLAFDADAAGQAAAERFYEWEKEHDLEVAGGRPAAGRRPRRPGRLPTPTALAAAVDGGHALPQVPGRPGARRRPTSTTPEGRARAAEAAVEVIAEHPERARARPVRDGGGRHAAASTPSQLRDACCGAPRRAPPSAARRVVATPGDGARRTRSPVGRRARDEPGQPRARGAAPRRARLGRRRALDPLRGACSPATSTPRRSARSWRTPRVPEAIDGRRPRGGRPARPRSPTEELQAEPFDAVVRLLTELAAAARSRTLTAPGRSRPDDPDAPAREQQWLTHDHRPPARPGRRRSRRRTQLVAFAAATGRGRGMTEATPMLYPWGSCRGRPAQARRTGARRTRRR